MDSVLHESILFDQFVAVVRIDVPIQREDVASRHVAGDDGDDARVGGAVVAGVGEFALLLLNVPIATAIGIASLAAVFANGGSIAPEVIVADRMIGGVGSFALLAIPFFVLSGILMGRGGMARRSPAS